MHTAGRVRSRSGGARAAIAVVAVAVGIALPVTGVANSAGASFTTCQGGAPASGSVLQAGQQLTNGQCLISSGGEYQLVLAPNDALDLISSSGALLWTASNAPAQGGVLTMQSDGNLVLYNSANQPLWSSNTTGLGGTTANLQDDGNFVIYTAGGAPVWSTNTSQTSSSVSCVGTPNTSTGNRSGSYPGSNLLAQPNQSATLQSGQALCAGGYVALMQSDGNLVLYSSGQPIWSAFTSGHPGASALLQNCSLAVGGWSSNPATSIQLGYSLQPGYSQLLLSPTGVLSVLCFIPGSTQETLWSSGSGGGGYAQMLSAACPPDVIQCSSTLTSPNRAYQLTMQPDGNLVDYFVANGNSFPVWSSGTGTPGSVAVMQDDGNLVIYPPNANGSSAASGALFATGTSTTDPVLTLDNSGNLTIWGTNAGANYSAWSSHSVSIIGDTLVAGETLQPGQGLLAAPPAGGPQYPQYRLSMGTNGAAELTETNLANNAPYSCPIWTTPGISAAGFSPSAQANAYLDLTTSGELELLAQGQQPGTGAPIWAAGSYGAPVTGGAKLVLQNDGNLVLFNGAGNSIWSSGSNYTASGGIWCTGMALGSTGVGSPTQAQISAYVPPGSAANQFDGTYTLAMQSDCNLVVYYGSNVTWASDTDKGDNPPAGTDPSSPDYGCYAVMQGDGNVVSYTKSGAVLWTSGTNQSSTLPGAPPIPGPYVAVVGYTGGLCTSGDVYHCPNYSGYSNDPNTTLGTSPNASLPSVAFTVATYDGLVLGTPDALSTPGEAATKIVTQVNTIYSYLANVFGSFGFPSAGQLGAAAWGTFSLGGLLFGTNCATGTNCAPDHGSGTFPPPVENLSTCGPSSPSAMAVGSNLVSGGCLESTNDQYQLIMQPDGNLVLYYQQGSNGYVIWASNTSGNPGAHAYLQTNGPLYVYSTSGAALFNTPGVSGGAAQAFLDMQNDGNLVLYANNVASGNGIYAVPYPAWSTQTSGSRGNTLASGEVLNPGQSLTGGSNGANGPGDYTLSMQTDGVLTLSQANDSGTTTQSSGCPLWTEPPIENIGPPTNYVGAQRAGAYLVMQTDGNLVLYGPGQNPTAIWQSGTSGYPGASLFLGSNGQLSIYDGSQLIWSNYSNIYRGGVLCSGATLSGISQQELTGYPAGSGSPQTNQTSANDELMMQGDCNLVLYIDNVQTGAGILAWSSGTSQGSNVANDSSSPYYNCYATQQSDGNFVVYAPNYPGGPKALWASGFYDSSAGPGEPNSAGPYALEFAPLNGNYAAATYDTVTGKQEWFSSYNVKENDTDYSTNGASSTLEHLGSWIHTLLGIIVAVAGA